jgi:integrase
LGFCFIKETRILSRLDRFLADSNNGLSDLSSEAFLDWCKGFGNVRSGTVRERMQIVRAFCLYRRRTEPDCFVPDITILPHPHQKIRPYIFSASEIQRLLDLSSCLARGFNSPLRPEIFRLVIVLLFTIGLRHGELLRLVIGDYDSDEGTLLIRNTKFHKSRLLPLPGDVCREIDRYLNVRRRRQFVVTPETPLVWSNHLGGRAYDSVTRNVRHLLKMAKIQKPDGQLPRIHDFRHSFAVNALLRWYKSGADVQSKLPFLSAYMGHVNISDTYHYLHLVEPLASQAATRFAKHYGAVLDAVSKGKGGFR